MVRWSRDRPSDEASRIDLVRRVFAIDPRPTDGPGDPAWVPFALRHDHGACVGSLETARLTFECDGAPVRTTAIRQAAVDPAWRGLGLFRDLMVAALAWCAETPGPTLLYTEEEALYTRFGFHAVPQYRFVGEAPPRRPRPAAVPIDRDGEVGLGLLRDAVARRSPVSRRCALVGGDGLILANLLSHETRLVHTASLDAVIAFEMGDDSLTLVDVLAPTMPSMAELLATLPSRPNASTLFVPDLLDWSATPMRDDTGLMARGALPDAMRRPFMLPPTLDF